MALILGCVRKQVNERDLYAEIRVRRSFNGTESGTEFPGRCLYALCEAGRLDFPFDKNEGQYTLSASTMAKDKIRPAAIKVGIRLEPGQRFGFHNFRHSLATFLSNKGKDVKTIQGLLRHAKASTTLDLYSQTIDVSTKTGGSEGHRYDQTEG